MVDVDFSPRTHPMPWCTTRGHAWEWARGTEGGSDALPAMSSGSPLASLHRHPVAGLKGVGQDRERLAGALAHLAAKADIGGRIDGRDHDGVLDARTASKLDAGFPAAVRSDG